MKDLDVSQVDSTAFPNFETTKMDAQMVRALCHTNFMSVNIRVTKLDPQMVRSCVTANKQAFKVLSRCVVLQSVCSVPPGRSGKVPDQIGMTSATQINALPASSPTWQGRKALYGATVVASNLEYSGNVLECSLAVARFD